MNSRKLAWTDEAWKDYLYWQSQDKKTLKRIRIILCRMETSFKLQL
ncbi:MAG: type II toxin-antitoxin system YoeB family toxin [Thermosynechococcaceae cyanobacterium]